MSYFGSPIYLLQTNSVSYFGSPHLPVTDKLFVIFWLPQFACYRQTLCHILVPPIYLPTNSVSYFGTPIYLLQTNSVIFWLPYYQLQLNPVSYCGSPITCYRHILISPSIYLLQINSVSYFGSLTLPITVEFCVIFWFALPVTDNSVSYFGSPYQLQTNFVSYFGSPYLLQTNSVSYFGSPICLTTTLSRNQPAPIPFPSCPTLILVNFSTDTASNSNSSICK